MKGQAIVLGLLVAGGACGGNKALTPDSGSGSGSAGAASGTAGAGSGGAGSGGSPFTVPIQQAVNRNVDIVFMIDDSSGMTPLQAKLGVTISAYFDVLKTLPGGLPNVHLGIVSSSMGAGRNPAIDHCPQGGDQGIFHSRPMDLTPGGPCTRASLDAGQSFLISVNGQSNFTGDIADAFSCLSLLGDGGCGFEHQFESVLRALGADGAPAPPQNANFLRPDAYLQVVFFTDEDDCSAPPDSDLFDSSSSTITDPLGPLQSYRCNEFGHLCGGKPPPRQPMGEVDLSGTCVSAEDGRLLRVRDVVTALKRLKADPSKVMVAALTGPPDPYKVNVGPSQVKGDPSMWPYVEHSCTVMEPNNDLTYADPSVRINQLVDAFGANGVFQDVCIPSYAPALQRIARQVGAALGVPCLPGSDPSKCRFVDSVYDAAGNVVDTPLPRCTDPSDPGPCWDVGPSTETCTPVIVRRPVQTSAGGYTTGTCTP
ncbi:MAG TPA: hypothetical protein VHL80_10860 [Polyangia bacterium]|nr:hypothetical protein [Polyangia bacterium]